MTLAAIFLIIALVLFLAAGFGVTIRNRDSLGWLGLAAVTLALILDSGLLRL